MADIDRAAFAFAVAERLAAKRLSYSLAVARWPSTNKALWSRVNAGKPLSAGNYLLVCKLLNLSPWRFWHPDKAKRVTMKTIVKQAVTAGVARETEVRP